MQIVICFSASVAKQPIFPVRTFILDELQFFISFIG